MAKINKNIAQSQAKIEKGKIYSLDEAVKLAKEISYVKFDASLDLAFNLNLDVRQVEQQLRGSIALPNGTGKNIKILAATDDVAQQKEANENKAEIVVGSEELQQILKTGKFDFDIIVADPKMMPILGRFGKVLGPKGLMPNPKLGTVTPNLGKTIKEIKKGKANYRTDKNGIVHTSIGKVSMGEKMLIENAKVIIEHIKKIKPNTIKGAYMKNLTISSTMGPSIKIEIL